MKAGDLIATELLSQNFIEMFRNKIVVRAAGIGNWYENRENAGDLPDAAKALLWPLRIWG
jgi:hypothetical protein